MQLMPSMSGSTSVGGSHLYGPQAEVCKSAYTAVCWLHQEHHQDTWCDVGEVVAGRVSNVLKTSGFQPFPQALSNAHLEYSAHFLNGLPGSAPPVLPGTTLQAAGCHQTFSLAKPPTKVL